MSKLRPIGSEKLQGDDKLKRIMEIARYNEVIPNSINENTKTEYTISLVDGYTYEIAKEKMGYVIKKRIDESSSEYIEPMKNRKHYSSYSSALKRLNLLAGELNRLHESSEGVSLFGEQKKYTLKSPKPMVDDASTEAPSEDEVTPPSPELPAEPTSDVTPPSEETPMPPVEDEMDSEMPPVEDEMDVEVETEEEPADEEGTSFKSIQKLTGKLSQKLRDFSSDSEMTSKDIKYVVNSILSALNLDGLDEEDKEEIISRFDEEEADYGDMDTMKDETDMDIEDTEEMPAEDEVEVDTEVKEEDYVGSVIDSIFSESKVDTLLQKYFSVNENEKKFIVEKKEMKKQYLKEKVKNVKGEIQRLSESTNQAKTSLDIIKNFPEITFVGKTNKGNLVFENNNKQLKVNRSGNIL